MEQQMTMNRKNSYVEILEILKYMDKIYVDKIPKKLIEFFEENKANNYKFKYDSAVELGKQNLNDNTLALLAMLNLNYWCESEEHKKELIARYNDNEQKYQEELHKKYNPDNIFKNNKRQEYAKENSKLNHINALAEIKKETLFDKTITFFKKLFKIN